jgi:hypothetical protein
MKLFRYFCALIILLAACSVPTVYRVTTHYCPVLKPTIGPEYTRAIYHEGKKEWSKYPEEHNTGFWWTCAFLTGSLGFSSFVVAFKDNE